MPESPTVIVDRWIKEYGPKYIVHQVSTILDPETVAVGKEFVAADEVKLGCDQGVVWWSSFALTSNRVAIRFQSPAFDTGNRFRVDEAMTIGEQWPNAGMWFRGPPDTPFYSILFVLPFTWTSWARLSIVNLDTAPIIILKRVYVASLLRLSMKLKAREEARRAEALSP